MECSRRRLSVIFCATVFTTVVFVLTSFHELPRSMFTTVFKDSFGNFSILNYNDAASDVWGTASGSRGENFRRYGNPPPMSKRISTKIFSSGVYSDLPVRPTQTVQTGVVSRASEADVRMEDVTTTVEQAETTKRTKVYDVSTNRVTVKKTKVFTAKGSTTFQFHTTAEPLSTKHSTVVNKSEKPQNSSLGRTKRFPDAIIIGVKKGGTRALLQFLSIHPSIRTAGKEIHFFDKDFNYNKGLAWYKDQMPLSYPNETVMEKTPGYFVAKMAPDRVYEMNPTVKLIVTFRDPTRRSISDYAQTLDKALTKEKLRRKDVKPFAHRLFLDKKKKIVNPDNPKIKIGMYAVHLKRWLRLFPKKQMHFISGENLVKQPWEELYRVQKFLNLPVAITRADFVLNKTKGFYCLKWKKNRKGGIKAGHCLNEDKGRRHPHVSMKTISTLQDFFRPLNNKLYRLTGRNFQWP